MQKPTGITASAALMVVLLILGLVATFTTALPLDQMNQAGSPISPTTAGSIVHVFAIVFTLIALVCIYFYWQGQNWARWLVMIYSVLCILALITIAKTFRLSPLNGGTKVVSALLGIFLLWYLNTAPIKDFFSKPAAVAP